MHNKKLLGIIALFVLIIISTLGLSIAPPENEEQKIKGSAGSSEELTRFEGIHYFKTKNLKPYMELEAVRLDIRNRSHLNFDSPSGSIQTKDRNLFYKADSGDFLQNSRKLFLYGDVSLKDKKNTYKSDKLSFDGVKNILIAKGNVESRVQDEKTRDTLDLKSESLKSYIDEKRVQLFNGVRGKLSRLRKYEGGFVFSANYVELNMSKSVVSLSKSVKIKRNNYIVSAQNAEIFLENFNKKLKYYSLYDDVKLEEKVRDNSSRVSLRKAYAEKLEAFQSTGKIVLTGAPRVEQGDDVIKGYQITLRENVELVEVDDSQSSFRIEREAQ